MGRQFLDGGYCPSLSLVMNWDSSVDIVTRLQTGRPMVPGIVLTSVRFIFSLRQLQTLGSNQRHLKRMSRALFRG
jgi:hypothetical protein